MAGEIVVGFDGSEGSRVALERALKIAQGLGVGVLAVYGYRAAPLGGEVHDYAQALHELGEKAMEEARKVAGEAGGPALETLVQPGDPADVLAELGSEREAPMVVVGSRSEHPLHGWLIGSVAHKLVHVSDVPVLVVPAKPLRD